MTPEDEKEIDKSLKEAHMNYPGDTRDIVGEGGGGGSKPINNLQEAPASVTYSITSPGGFNALFTVRDMTGLDLLIKMKVIETKLIDCGYKPQIKGSFAPKPVEYASYPCPKCGKKVVKGFTKDGKKFEKCETQKYDFTSKTTTGCDYFIWINV